MPASICASRSRQTDSASRSRRSHVSARTGLRCRPDAGLPSGIHKAADVGQCSVNNSDTALIVSLTRDTSGTPLRA